ncbi:hypothetical protein CBS101457_006771 [Exobasidium rhododendri]|nr:hypothetical protein CBS101457_006771 [Exobasidium rhododendri]
MFANLPHTEKQAFFSILDEYFTARPHLLSGSEETAETSSAYASTSAPRRTNPPAPPATRKPASALPSQSNYSLPANLTSGKAFGNIKTSSAGAAIGSMLMNQHKQQGPRTPADTVNSLHSAASRMNFGQPQRATPAAAVPSPPPPPPPAPSHSTDLGQAEVLYEYKGTEAEDLSVRPYDIITLLEKINDDWWKAEAGDGSGRTGLVPSSYVKLI